MYKSEIEKALETIALAPDGLAAGLIQHAVGVEANAISVLENFLSAGLDSNSANKMQSAMHSALSPLSAWIAKMSPMGIGIELHGLGVRFDKLLTEKQSLEPLLQPGRQALGELSGAFDVVLQRNKHPSSLLGLIRPAAALATCYAHYTALRTMFSQLNDLGDEDDLVVVEVDGAEGLEAFAAYISSLSYLASVAAKVLHDADDSPHPSTREIRIESIESGSPVQIKLLGDGKTLRLLMTMIRDAFRGFTPYGRTIRAMETLAYAKKLGIKSSEALGQLESAVDVTSRHYADSLRSRDVVVSVNGEVVQQPLALLPAVDGEGRPALPSPKE